MAEIEIHHDTEHAADPGSKRVGLMVGVIGVVLAVVTIVAHREHTKAVIDRTEANDAWAYYQAKKIREHMSAVGSEIVRAVGTESARVELAVGRLEEQRKKYIADAEQQKGEADLKDAETKRSERLALRLDIGEGFIELGLVLSSLYFLGRQRLFPLAGGIAALIGMLTAASALLL
jgi:Domain of unknown function (DUF4337)